MEKKPILTVEVREEMTTIGCEGSLREIIAATCHAVNGIYCALDDESKTLFKAFVRIAVFDPASPFWDEKKSEPEKLGYKMDKENIIALNAILSKMKEVKDAEGTDG